MAIDMLYDERALLRKISEGDEQAFRTIFDRFYNKVFGYAFKLLRLDFAAEEVVQEVFLSIWLNRTNLGQIENFGAYLRTVSRNRALSALRKNARETVAFSLNNQEWNDTDPGTEHAIAYKELHLMLNSALNTLPPQQKLVYQLCKLDGRKQAEVAQQLDISILTVKVHLRTASQTIRTYLRTHGDVVFSLIFISVNQILIK